MWRASGFPQSERGTFLSSSLSTFNNEHFSHSSDLEVKQKPQEFVTETFFGFDNLRRKNILRTSRVTRWVNCCARSKLITRRLITFHRWRPVLIAQTKVNIFAFKENIFGGRGILVFLAWRHDKETWSVAEETERLLGLRYTLFVTHISIHQQQHSSQELAVDKFPLKLLMSDV